MVARVHHHAAHRRAPALVTVASGLADVLVLVVQVAHLPDRCHAGGANTAHLAGGKTDGRHLALLGQQLRAAAGASHDLAASSGHHLDVVDLRTERDLRQWQCVADARLHIRAGRDLVTDAEPVRQEHVALLAVGVVQQGDASRSVRVVLDGCDGGGHADLVALPIDQAVEPLMPGPLVTDRELALGVATRLADHALGERLVGLAGGDLLECRAGLLAGGDGHHRLAPAGHRAHRFAAAPLLLGLDRHDANADNGHLELGLHGRADLQLVRFTGHLEGVVIALGLGNALFADDRSNQDVVDASGGHAYTSWARLSASVVNTIVSASSRSTTLRLSASRTRTSRRLRQERSTIGSRTANTTRTLPPASQTARRSAHALVPISSRPNPSTTRSAPSDALALSTPCSAARRILAGIRC